MKGLPRPRPLVRAAPDALLSTTAPTPCARGARRGEIHDGLAKATLWIRVPPRAQKLHVHGSGSGAPLCLGRNSLLHKRASAWVRICEFPDNDFAGWGCPQEKCPRSRTSAMYHIHNLHPDNIISMVSTDVRLSSDRRSCPSPRAL